MTSQTNHRCVCSHRHIASKRGLIGPLRGSLLVVGKITADFTVNKLAIFTEFYGGGGGGDIKKGKGVCMRRQEPTDDSCVIYIPGTDSKFVPVASRLKASDL